MRLVLATRNQGKIEELRQILAGHVKVGSGAGSLEVVGLELFPDAPDVPETEPTFVGNAVLKARSIAEFTGSPAVADDSGLCVDALNGMPGILSARWAGRSRGGHGSVERDRANVELVLDQLADFGPDQRGAHFVCAAALALPPGAAFAASSAGEGREHCVEGRMHGRIIERPRGDGGFGYDPIFVPNGETRTVAELPAERKNEISHRGQAFRALVGVLPELLGLSH